MDLDLSKYKMKDYKEHKTILNVSPNIKTSQVIANICIESNTMVICLAQNELEIVDNHQSHQ